MPRKLQPISPAIRAKLEEARVARLATLEGAQKPHIVPVCFGYNGKGFYSAVDRKPKRVAPQKLARLQNIGERPQVAVAAVVHSGARKGKAGSEFSASGAS